HSAMPSATPPSGTSVAAAGIAPPARSPATEPTCGAAAGLEDAGSGAAAAQLPSGLTRSSGATGPLGPSEKFLAVAIEPEPSSRDNRLLTGFENHPASERSVSLMLFRLPQPPTASAMSAAPVSASFDLTSRRTKINIPGSNFSPAPS